MEDTDNRTALPGPLCALPTASAGRVLIAEDDSAIQELERYILTTAGYEVCIAATARQAVELIRAQDFQAVALDYRLPDGDPWAVLEAAKARKPSIPVLMITAGASEEIAALATQRGVAEYAIKDGALWERLPTTIRRIIELAGIEQKMRQSDALFELISSQTSDLISILEMDGAIHFTSAASRTLLGYEPGEVIGRSPGDFAHPEDSPAVEAFLGKLAATGRATVEYRSRHKSGTYVWLESHASLLAGSQNLQGEAAVVISRDISARKQADAALRAKTKQLRESEERYRDLVENVEDYAILMLDPRGNVASWTIAAERIKGYTSNEILGKHFSCFYTPEDLKRGLPAEVLRHAASNGRLHEEGVRVRKDGSRFWASVSIAAIRSETGGLRGFSKITRDITNRVQSEEKIRQDEEKFRALLESAPDAVVIADRNGSICLVNAQAERLFGYSRQELEGQAIEMLMPDHLRSTHAEHRENYARVSRVRQMGSGMELMGLRKSGEEFPVEVSLSPIHTSQGSWVAAAVRDTTDRKATEQQLIVARQRAEDASRAKSEFLATVSHEIRTPMNAILGVADLLVDTSLNEEQRKYVGLFRRAGANLMTLINDILDLAKIESGHLELTETEFGISQLLEQVTELMLPKATANGIALEVELLPDVANRRMGDPDRVRQVLINLVGNAIKFTEQGHVCLAIQTTAGLGEAHLQFEISDTGIGIDPDRLGTIFEDFKQGEASIARKYGGTGLGLGISRKLVELMGGQISVTSVVGRGSTFRVQLPLPLASGDSAHPQVQGRAASHGKIRTSARLRILIAEDSEDNQLLMQWYCKDTPYQLTFARNGEEAVRWVNSREFDIVLMDMQMPLVDGLTATRGIRAFERSSGRPPMPILALSANARSIDVKTSLEAGCNAHLAKPISRDALLDAIARYAGQAELRSTLNDGLAALVPRYLAARHSDVVKLTDCLAGGDLVGIRNIAHNLKGTGTSYGFPRLTDLGARMCEATESSDEAALRLQISELAGELVESGTHQPDSFETLHSIT